VASAPGSATALPLPAEEQADTASHLPASTLLRKETWCVQLHFVQQRGVIGVGGERSLRE
jgi:hypothetical protein